MTRNATLSRTTATLIETPAVDRRTSSPTSIPTSTPDASSAVHRPEPLAAQAPIVDNRVSYLAWGVAWLVGYGAFALTSGANPVLSLPSMVPVALLAVGLVGAFVVTTVSTARAQRGVTGPAALAGKLSGGAWAVGFTALFLLITGLAGQLGDQHLQTLMWPAGSGLVVGLLYLMGGAVNRDVLQYALGAWIALTVTAAVFLGLSGLYWVLALAGSGAYFAAAVLEPRRRAAAARR